MKNIVVVSISLFFLITSCHKSQSPERSSELNRIAPFQKLRSSHFTQSHLQAIEGSGAIVFTQPLEGAFRPTLFELKFLLSTSQSQIEFIFFHQTLSMQEGLSLEFKRLPQLTIWLHQAGGLSYDITSYFVEREHQIPWTLRVGIANDEQGIKILIWDNKIKNLTLENALFNSQEQKLTLRPLRFGANWGLRFNQSVILRATHSHLYVF